MITFTEFFNLPRLRRHLPKLNKLPRDKNLKPLPRKNRLPVRKPTITQGFKRGWNKVMSVRRV